MQTLSAQDNTKLLQKLKSGFKRTIYWKKYQSKVITEAQKQCFDYLVDPKQCFDYLVDPSFQDD